MIVGSIKTRSRSKEGTNKLILGHWLHSLGRLDVRLKGTYIVLDDIVERGRWSVGQQMLQKKSKINKLIGKGKWQRQG